VSGLVLVALAQHPTGTIGGLPDSDAIPSGRAPTSTRRRARHPATLHSAAVTHPPESKPKQWPNYWQTPQSIDIGLCDLSSWQKWSYNGCKEETNAKTEDQDPNLVPNEHKCGH